MTEPETTDSDVPTADDGDEGGDIAEPRHTRGPWEAKRVTLEPIGEAPDNVEPKEAWTVETAYDHPQLKGPIPVIAKTVGFWGENFRVKEEDARLMAAAPRMSAALENLIREAEDAADALEDLGDDGDAGMLRLQIEQAKHTLNNARGAA